MSKCQICGGELPQSSTKPRQYCDACRIVRAAEYEEKKLAKEKAAKAIDNIFKAGDNPLKKKRTSLTQILKCLDSENAKRREQGLVPLGYGKYVAMLSNGAIN